MFKSLKNRCCADVNADLSLWSKISDTGSERDQLTVLNNDGKASLNEEFDDVKWSDSGRQFQRQMVREKYHLSASV